MSQTNALIDETLFLCGLDLPSLSTEGKEKLSVVYLPFIAAR